MSCFLVKVKKMKKNHDYCLVKSTWQTEVTANIATAMMIQKFYGILICYYYIYVHTILFELSSRSMYIIEDVSANASDIGTKSTEDGVVTKL